jgi:hypothetical protein
MADQDFNIRVITTADTSGLRATSAEMDAVARKADAAAAAAAKQMADAEAKWARSPLNPRNAAPAGGPGAGPSDTAGLTGSAAGLGTIITLVTVAINKWKEFNAEQDRWVDGMIKAEEKARALGESILDMQDKARNAARVGTEPLEQSFIRLQQEIIRLKTEQSLLNLPEQGEEWKKLQQDINITASQLKAVTNELEKQSTEAKKAAQAELEKRVPGLKAEEPIKQAEAQTQRILMNEQAAARARAEGREKDAEMFEKSADAYKASATPQQLADLQRIHELQDKLKPPAKPQTIEEWREQQRKETDKFYKDQQDAWDKYNTEIFGGPVRPTGQVAEAAGPAGPPSPAEISKLQKEQGTPGTGASMWKQLDEVIKAVDRLGQKFEALWR